MRKAQKQEVLGCVDSLHQAHEEIREALNKNNTALVRNMLSECQDFAVSLGENIERLEGEGHVTVSHLESYCEALFQAYEGADNTGINVNKVCKTLKKHLLRVENSVRNDIRVRNEIVFLPYKAAMWDSLESVYLAAKADPDCDAYCVPIPYYEKNPDGSMGKMHYEGLDYPDNIQVIDWQSYQFEERKPDAIFIHNPYDSCNYVTSVHPRFYSDNLKRYTDCLVYIPYYATAGGMSEGQSLCPAYINADYIVIQSEDYRKFFDKRLPDNKFLPMGSPKFDRVIHKCQNPPEPPAEWKLSKSQLERMKNSKVYFYNTSIGGMLANTEAFLKKMRYVFDIFKGREDACLIWRPHPLLESTFSSMRGMYKPQFDALKKEFVEENIGILDETTDIENTIALSDIYIGDSGTSVTSLFGVAGKPLFILNNNIHTLPEKDDWRGERITPQFDVWGDDRYQVTGNNQLWYSEKNDYHYKFYMDLETGYSEGGYYRGALEINDRIYVLPGNAQHLLIIKDKKIRRIDFKEPISQKGAFFGYWYAEKYIFLFPFRYPYFIRFNIDTEELCYVDGINRFNVRNVEGEWRAGGIGIYKTELVFASPVDNEFVFMDMNTFKARSLSSNSGCNLGTQVILTEGDNLWLLPLNGMTLTCWNPKTGNVREYSNFPQGFKSIQWPLEYECGERPFSNIAFSGEGSRENIILSPCWGNMYLSLNRETGQMEEWKSPMKFKTCGRNGYFAAQGIGRFVITYPQRGKADCRIWYAPERKLYEINIDTGEYKEVEIEFDYDDLLANEAGFMEESEWMQYCLDENAFNSLKNLLDGRITGNQFDRERQLKAFSKINVDTEGTCGMNVHNFVKGKIT